MWIDSCGVIPSEARNLYDCQRKMLLMTEISRSVLLEMTQQIGT